MAEYVSSGTLTTTTKSFADPVKPDLTSLVYSLNGESITIDVVGSPGTASEEIITQSLDGGSDYNLNWSTAHTDFRLEFTLSTADTSTTPVFDEATLEYSEISGDNDQNPKRTWRIGGAIYDRSGNEYEGGGVEAVYGG